MTLERPLIGGRSQSTDRRGVRDRSGFGRHRTSQVAQHLYRQTPILSYQSAADQFAQLAYHLGSGTPRSRAMDAVSTDPRAALHSRASRTGSSAMPRKSGTVITGSKPADGSCPGAPRIGHLVQSGVRVVHRQANPSEVHR